MNTHTPLYVLTSALSQLWEEAGTLLEASSLTSVEEAAIGRALTDVETRMKALEGTHADKCLNLACLIKNVEGEGEMVKAEEVRLKARRQSAERKAEWLRAYLANNMEPGTNLRDGRAAISWRKSQAVDVAVKPEDLLEAFRRTKVIVEADKDAIKMVLAGGATIPGCSLVTRYNLQIK